MERYQVEETNPPTLNLHWLSFPYFLKWWYFPLLYQHPDSKRHLMMPSKWLSPICCILSLKYLDLFPSCSESDTNCIENELAYGLLYFTSLISLLIPLSNLLLNLYLPRVNHTKDLLCNNIRTTSSDMESITHAKYKSFRRIIQLSSFWHLMQLNLHMNDSWLLPSLLSLQVNSSGCSKCTIHLYDCPMYPLIPVRDNRKKQSNDKRFMFSQCPKWHSNSYRNQQVRFLTHIFSPKKCNYSRDHHQVIIVGTLKLWFHQYV